MEGENQWTVRAHLGRLAIVGNSAEAPLTARRSSGLPRPDGPEPCLSCARLGARAQWITRGCSIWSHSRGPSRCDLSVPRSSGPVRRRTRARRAHAPGCTARARVAERPHRGSGLGCRPRAFRGQHATRTTSAPGTRRPDTPSSTCSGRAPTALTMTGTPAAYASRMLRGAPSYVTEGRTRARARAGSLAPARQKRHLETRLRPVRAG